MAQQSKKTKNNYKPMRVVIALGSLLVLASVGSLTSTYAWFEYRAKAGLDYHGTAVGDGSNMTIGIYSGYYLPDALTYGLERDPENNNLYWSKENSLDTSMLKYYSEVSGYAYNKLTPTTTSHYESGMDLTLYSAPNSGATFNPNYRADKGEYLYLPIVFKISDKNRLENENVSLNSCVVNGPGSIQNGLRIFFDNGENNFLFNPNKQNSGFDEVGGILDLDMDGYYDYHINKESNRQEEIYYGESVVNPVFNDETSKDLEPLPYDKRDTYIANHKADTYGIDLVKTKAKKANYLGYNDVISKKPVGYVDKTNNVIRVDMTIYVEGWSKYVNNKVNVNYFDLNLDFELWG